MPALLRAVRISLFYARHVRNQVVHHQQCLTKNVSVPQGNDEFLRLSRMAMVNSMFASKEAVVDVMKREGGLPGRE